MSLAKPLRPQRRKKKKQQQLTYNDPPSPTVTLAPALTSSVSFSVGDRVKVSRRLPASASSPALEVSGRG